MENYFFLGGRFAFFFTGDFRGLVSWERVCLRALGV